MLTRRCPGKFLRKTCKKVPDRNPLFLLHLTIDTLEAETLCPPKLATLNWAYQQPSVLFVFGEFENPKQCSCVFAGVKSAWLSYS